MDLLRHFPCSSCEESDCMHAPCCSGVSTTQSRTATINSRPATSQYSRRDWARNFSAKCTGKLCPQFNGLEAFESKKQSRHCIPRPRSSRWRQLAASPLRGGPPLEAHRLVCASSGFLHSHRAPSSSNAEAFGFQLSAATERVSRPPCAGSAHWSGRRWSSGI